MEKIERDLFEAYILTERGTDYLKREADGDYSDHFVQEGWEAWQACSKTHSPR
jgi:hypothetical protein